MNDSGVQQGSREFYEQVRRGLESLDPPSSLNRWCLENAKVFSTVRDALLGVSDSHRARDIRQRLAREARVE